MKITHLLGLIIASFTFLQPASGGARTLKIRAVDESGAAFPNVLVIVRSLRTNLELARFLTNVEGETSDITSSAGPVQIIATCPYGICRTVVSEYLAETLPETLLLNVPVRSTDELGELIGPPKVSIIVNSRNTSKQTSAGVDLLVRDGGALRQRWYRSDIDGRVSVALLGSQTWVVLFLEGRVVRYVLTDDCSRLSPGSDFGVTCLKPRAGEVHIQLP
jgi:hypothetical protein